MTESQVLLEIAALAAGALGRHIAPKAQRAIRRKKQPAPAIAVPAFGIDYAYGAPPASKLKAAGVRFVIRYVSPDPAKNLTLAESLRLARQGIKRVVVWESTANRALEGIDAGIADAREALAQLAALHAPHDAAVYMAIDFDATGPDVEPYFQGAKSVLGDRLGAYGGDTPLTYLRDRHLVRYLWQTYAWSGGRWIEGAQLHQYDNGRTMFGTQVDFDHALTIDCGWW